MNNTTLTLTIPRRFFDDHAERELATPTILRETARTVTIRRDDPDFAELVSDAEFYSHEDGPDECGILKRAAVALLKSIRR